MGDTKRGRETQARDEARRQGEWEVTQARQRGEEPEPPRDGGAVLEREDGAGSLAEREEGTAAPRDCHRRGCDEPAAFLVLERYLEDTGHGAVEATAALCGDHTAEEGPARLDDVYSDYVFRIEPLPGTTGAREP